MNLKRLGIVVGLVLVAACQMTPTGDLIIKGKKQPVQVYHDDSLHVTCWVTVSGQGDGIACLPDAQVFRQQ